MIWLFAFWADSGEVWRACDVQTLRMPNGKRQRWAVVPSHLAPFAATARQVERVTDGEFLDARYLDRYRACEVMVLRGATYIRPVS